MAVCSAFSWCHGAVLAFHLEAERVDHVVDEFVGVEFLFLERHLAAVKHGHLQYLFHLEAEPLGLVVDDGGEVAEGGHVFCLRRGR